MSQQQQLKQILYRYNRPDLLTEEQLREIPDRETCEMDDLAWHKPTQYDNIYRKGYCSYAPNQKTIQITGQQLENMLQQNGGVLPPGLVEVQKYNRKKTNSGKIYTPRRRRDVNPQNIVLDPLNIEMRLPRKRLAAPTTEFPPTKRIKEEKQPQVKTEPSSPRAPKFVKTESLVPQIVAKSTRSTNGYDNTQYDQDYDDYDGYDDGGYNYLKYY